MRIYILIIIILLGETGLLFSQSISGVINNYTIVTAIDAICRPEITVTSTAGFSVDDTVMIIQMKGATVDLNNSAAFGNITNYGSAGNYEFNYIAAIIGNSIILKRSLTRTYDTGNIVQLVTVPFYNGNVTVSGTLTAQAWNGSTGGILVFEAAGTVTLNADINASGRGFRGGQPSTSVYNPTCDYTPYTFNYPSSLGAEKGEGVAIISNANRAGRGAGANGGGGGNSHNSGGGGGGNGSFGGRGGNDLNTCGGIGGTSSTVGGVGGYALSYTNALNKIFLGGGGGGGHQNDLYLSSTPGTAGGGIIIIKAASINGNGNTISANGTDQTANSGADGSGGGGAGGTILLDVQNYTSATAVAAKGGRGGNPTCNSCSNPIVECLGPGGGGGGGAIWFNNNSLPANVSTVISGGNSGLYMHPISTCYNTPNGAEAGNTGIEVFDLVLPLSGTSNAPFQLTLNSFDIFCNNSGMATVSAAGGTSPYTYVWSNGGTTDTVYLSQAGTYSVTVNDAGGCSATDTVSITAFSGISIANNANICQGDSLFVGGDFQTQSGTYYDTLTAATGCDSVITTMLQVNTATYSSSSVAICSGDSVFAGGDFQTQSGIYYDTIISATGCDSVIATTLQVSTATYSSSSVAICSGDSFFAGGDFQTQSGTYYDTIISASGCDSVITTTLQVNTATYSNFSVAICSHDSIFAGGSFQTQTGIYYDTLTAANACDSVIITNVQVYPAAYLNITSVICLGDSVFAGGLYQTQAGTYYDTLIAATGCDSVIITTLQIYPAFTNIPLAICSGDSVFAGGNFQTQSGIYYDTLISATGCDSVIATTIQVNAATHLNNAAAICRGDSIYAGGNFQTQAGIYVDSLLSIYGCDSIVATTVTVSDEIIYTISDDDSIAAGESIQLQVTGDNFYTWSPSATLNCNNCANPTAQPTVTTTYLITVSNSSGCFITDSVTVYVSYEGCNAGSIIAPHAFTPNDDNTNDLFFVNLINGATLEFLEVYDRWGEKIFRTENALTGWDGTFKGKACMPGVYVYLARANCLTKSFLKKGSVTLIK